MSDKKKGRFKRNNRMNQGIRLKTTKAKDNNTGELVNQNLYDYDPKIKQ